MATQRCVRMRPILYRLSLLRWRLAGCHAGRLGSATAVLRLRDASAGTVRRVKTTREDRAACL